MNGSSKNRESTIKQIKSFLKNKNCLIAIPNANERAMIKTLLKEINISSDKIHFSTNSKESLDKLNSHLPEILIIDSKLNTVLDNHLELIPTRNTTITISIGKALPYTDQIEALSYFCDVFIERPIVKDNIYKAIKSIAKNKALLDENSKTTLKLLTPFFKKDFENLEPSLSEISEKNIDNEMSYYIRGHREEQQNNKDAAIEYYKRSLEINPQYYNSLIKILNIHIKKNEYKKAYPYLLQILKNFPVDPTQLSNIAKTFVAAEDIRGLLSFCDNYISLEKLEQMFEQYENKSAQVVSTLNQVAIYLVASAKFCTQNLDNQQAKELLIKANKIMGEGGHVKIKSQIINELVAMGEKNQAMEILESISDQDISNDLMVTKIFLEQNTMQPGKLLDEGLKLLNKGLKDPRIYDIVIRHSVSLGKRKAFIEDIIQEATKNHPSMSNHFKRYINKNDL